MDAVSVASIANPDAGALTAPAVSQLDITILEDEREAPIDFGGLTPGLAGALPSRSVLAAAPAASSVPVVPAGGALAHQAGVFGAPFAWPIVPIHMVLLSDGRVLAWGTDTSGRQAGLLIYAVFDPADRIAPFMVLPNATGTDIFCSAQTLLPNGQVLIAGGDRTVSGVRNFGNADVNLFDRRTNVLSRQATSMRYQRWYGTLVTLPSGDTLALGGQADRAYAGPLLATTAQTFSATPEIFRTSTGWRVLPGATSVQAFGTGGNYSYPKAWVVPSGKVIVLGNQGVTYQLDTSGAGRIEALNPVSTVKLAPANPTQPAVMHRPGRILAARNGTRVQEVDASASAVTVRELPAASAHRHYGSYTVLADGTVFSNGGGSSPGPALDYNVLDGAIYTSEIWDPVSETWHPGPAAAKPRLYHSNALLLKDGTVLTGGGGAPGPVLNLNAEIYYPSYLWKKDGSGRLADRPVILSVSSAVPTWGQRLDVVMSQVVPMRRATLVRMGAATHAFNGDQRFLELDFTQSGRELLVTMPARAQIAPPGYYLLFVFDAQGVPSVAQTLRLG